jgi:hypothetical protein
MPYADPEKARENARKRQAEYRERNRDKSRAASAAWRAKNPEKHRENVRRWRAENREYHREYSRQHKLAARTPCPLCGQPKKKTARVCIRCLRGEYTGNWKGGAFVRNGYRHVLAPDEPGAAKNGYIAEHRLVMQRLLGRSLLPDETVHHKNGVRDDNRPENLELWVSSHPGGQRVEDLVTWAREVLERYG